MANLISLPAQPARISPKLRQAVDLMVREGKSQIAAAEAAGLSRQGLGKALKRSGVREHIQAVQSGFIAEIEGARGLYRARAFDLAWHLAQHAQSEAVKARMIEFLCSDGKVSPVAVHIDARSGRGYEYVPPGSRIVEVEAGPSVQPLPLALQ